MASPIELLKIEVLKIEEMIGLKDFRERSGVAQMNESSLY